jgi:hypothetical protein
LVEINWIFCENSLSCLILRPSSSIMQDYVDISTDINSESAGSTRCNIKPLDRLIIEYAAICRDLT